MNWKSHLMIGIFISIAFIAGMHYFFDWYNAEPFFVAQMVMIVGLSSLLPDIDHKKSKVARLLTGIGLVLASIGVLYAFLVEKGIEFIGTKWKSLIVVGVILATATFFISEVSTHRGFMHSILFCLIFGTIIFVLTKFNYELGTLAFVGCYSHLLADKKPFKVT